MYIRSTGKKTFPPYELTVSVHVQPHKTICGLSRLIFYKILIKIFVCSDCNEINLLTITTNFYRALNTQI